jgi:hypothetical protein
MNVIYYNVHRTKTLTKAWTFLSKNDCLDLIFCELATALNALVCGKSKVIDSPYIMKQQNTPSSTSKDWIRKMDILDRMFVEKWTQDINQLINDIANKASEAGNCVKAEALPQIRLALKNHYADRLFSYLEQRDLAKKKANSKSVEISQKIPKSCGAENITISQPREVHSSLRQIVSFLTKGGEA